MHLSLTKSVLIQVEPPETCKKRGSPWQVFSSFMVLGVPVLYFAVCMMTLRFSYREWFSIIEKT